MFFAGCFWCRKKTSLGKWEFEDEPEWKIRHVLLWLLYDATLYAGKLCTGWPRTVPVSLSQVNPKMISFSNDDGDGNENGKKEIAYKQQQEKQQLCTCITYFYTFPFRYCTTTTCIGLISRFVEDVNSRRRLSFPFPDLQYSPLEFNSRNIRQHLTKWTRWNKCEKQRECIL